ncbi:MAG: M48 family metallopeptidase [Egibacteraceae bacterium]
MAVVALPERLDVGDLTFAVQHRPNRRTLEITVERDASLSIKVPDGVSIDQIESFVAAKRLWIYRKLAEKDALLGPPVTKTFVTGEGFAYLGRSYRLLLVDAQEPPVKLEHGRFRLRRDQAASGREMRRWYCATGASWLARRITPWSRRVLAGDIAVEVSDLGYRWGSAGASPRVNVHWAALQLPPTLIDYVLVHELVHVLEPNHTGRFWQLVARALPDFEERKTKLAASGAALWLGDTNRDR